MNTIYILILTVYVIDLVSSTLADPYLSYAAALYALAGPLHGYVFCSLINWTKY